MKKMCIFDLDGTLIDSLPAISHFANTAIAAIGLEPIPSETYKKYVGNGMDILLHRCLNHYNQDTDDNFAVIRPVYKNGYDADVLYKTYPYDGINETLKILKDIGIKLCVLSNKPDNVVVDAVSQLFGKDFFDIVIGQRENMKKKPEPDGVFEICKKTGITPKETVFVGDTNVDINTSNNAGTYSVGVLWGFRGRQELEEAGADLIISKPSELLNVFEENK